MEEIANLLWLGHILARHGPPGFQALWSQLRPAAVHYIYGFNATQEACQEAAKKLRCYAVSTEEMVIDMEVR
jgi:hypothetical protein